MDVLSGLLAALLAPPAGTMLAGVEIASADVRRVQLTVRRQLIIRVPARPAPAPLTAWKERRGSKCLTVADLAGASVSPEGVDFFLRGGKRVRAKLDSSCPALAYYSGFYVVPTADGRICADRDAVHDRSGSECEITRFRTLEPKAPRAR